MIEAIHIKISLDKTNPTIWREILVPKDISFYKLHHVIQLAMGWTNSHLFEFIIEGYRVGEIYEKMEGLDVNTIIDSKETKLIDLVNETGEEFKYWYDFGDSWMHTVVIERFGTVSNKQQLPFCAGGELKCPPEDCGGIGGFYDFLSIISDKKHKGYKETIRWAGGKYDPNDFDLIKVNKKLKSIDKYIKSLED